MFTKRNWLEFVVIFMLLVPHGQAGAYTCECPGDDTLTTQDSLSHAPSETNPMSPRQQHLKADSDHCEMCEPDKCLCCEGLYAGCHILVLTPIHNDICFKDDFYLSPIATDAQSLASGFSVPPFHPPITC